MKAEDELLKTKIGNQRPFKVPEGYFEGMASRVMSQLPEREERRFSMRVPLLKYSRYAAAAAAVLCLAIGGTAVYMGKSGGAAEQRSGNVAAANASYAEGTLDDVAEYAMMDNDDMYVLISNY